jgi:hypothetical protein
MAHGVSLTVEARLNVGGLMSRKTVTSSSLTKLSAKDTTTVLGGVSPEGACTAVPGSFFAPGTPSRKIAAPPPTTKPNTKVITYLIDSSLSG